MIKVQLMETPEKSNRQIAAGLGVDHKTVSSARKALEADGEIPQQETIITKDGKARPRKGSGDISENDKRVPDRTEGRSDRGNANIKTEATRNLHTSTLRSL